MKSSLRWALAASLLSMTGCCGSQPHVANLSGLEVVSFHDGSVEVGTAQKISGADPVPLQPARSLPVSDCHTRDEFDAAYGQRCEGFVPTAQGGAATPTGVSGSTPGLHPTAKEEAWYCDAHWVVRLALVLCTPADGTHPPTFRVDQLVITGREGAVN